MKKQSFLSSTQSLILATLLLGMALPYARAQQLPVPPDTSHVQSDAGRQAVEAQRIAQTVANNAVRSTLDSQNVPVTLRQSLEGNTPDRTANAARRDGYTAVEDTLAGHDLPAVDPVAAINDAGPLVDAGINDPTRLNNVVGMIQTAYTTASNQTSLAQLQSYWAAGVQGSANCSASDDDGKDLCTAIVELNDLLDDIDSDLTTIVSSAKTLKSFVSTKAAFMPTASYPPKICTGLAVSGPGVNLSEVAIAETDQRYDVSDGRLSFADARSQLLAAGNIGQSVSQLTGGSHDALSFSSNVLNTNAQTYSGNVAAVQQTYDHLEALMWQKFDTTISARLTTFKKHSDELKQFSGQLRDVLTRLSINPRTP